MIKMSIAEVLLTYDEVLATYKNKQSGKKALVRYRALFPIRSSARVAGIIADLMGDGHLQPWPKLRIDYTSKSTIELQRFNNEIHAFFGVKGRVRKCTTNRYGTKNIGVNNKPLARTLGLLGVPAGNKVFQRFPIPTWILNDKAYFARFINRLISCEGCVDTKNRYIELKMYKTTELLEDGMVFFRQIKQGLKNHFGIETTEPFLEGRTNRRKDGRTTKGIRIKIKRKEAVKRFYEHIGIEDKKKHKKLEKITR